MLYSCTHMATIGVKGLNRVQFQIILFWQITSYDNAGAGHSLSQRHTHTQRETERERKRETDGDRAAVAAAVADNDKVTMCYQC